MGAGTTQDNIDVAVSRMNQALRGWYDRNRNTLIAGGLIILVWQLYSQFVVQSNNYLPSPRYTLINTIESHEVVIQGLQTTLIEVFAGLIAGVSIGLVLGILVAESFLMRRIALPWVIFIYSVPAAIVAPLFLVWFGINLLAIALFVALLSFFPVFISTLTGFTNVQEEHYNLGEISGATRWQMAKNIKFWVALPHIFAGIRVAVQSSVVGAIVAEFIASNSGLGYLIVTAYEQLQIGLMFGTLFILMLVAMTVYQLINFLLELAKPGPMSSL